MFSLSSNERNGVAWRSILKTESQRLTSSFLTEIQDGGVNALPSSFLAECDALFESALEGGDLTNFYYLVCGEDRTLHRLLEERKNVAKAGFSGIDVWDENSNKKIANSGDGGGRGNNRKKSKNDKTNPPHENQANRAPTARPTANGTAVLDAPRKRSVTEIDWRCTTLTRPRAFARPSA